MTMDLKDLAGRARIPTQHDKVFNEECLFSYDTPESPDGLYICMEKFLGFGRDYVEQYHKRTDNALFVHIRRRKVPIKKKEGEEAKEVDGVPEKVSRLAIGLPGGFDSGVEKKFEYEEEHSVVVLPGFKKYPIDSQEVPLAIQMSAKAIIKAESALKKLQLEEMAGTWDGEKLQNSKFFEFLEQLDNGVKIPTKGWKCSKCDLTDNLWLNLTDGSILCGRKYADGSGGNNHAAEHYDQKKYPLAVKLGTITADKGDVYSYVEDEMVLDPKLTQHLAHFGIDRNALSKTDKSMVELDIDLNKKWEFSRITEAGSKLTPAYGRGFTGLSNLGNTCYMNSVMQLLFTLPPFIERYVNPAPQFFAKANLQDPLSDFNLQMCKLGYSIWSGRYSGQPTEADRNVEGDDWCRAIRPSAFKAMIGRGHREFSTNRQQDAQEFYLHLCNLMEKSLVGEETPIKCLQFEVEDRTQCGSTGKVQYSTRVEDLIPLPVPVSESINKAEVDAYIQKRDAVKAAGGNIQDIDVIQPIVPFDVCLRAALGEEQVLDWTSPANHQKTFARKTFKLLTFPDFLMLQLKKFAFGDDQTAYKLDVEVQMPDEMDLSVLKKAQAGMQEGEEPMPGEHAAAAAAAPALVPDPAIVDQLTQMGFDINGCKKAAFNTKNAGLEAATNWVMEHMDDADFAAPFVQASVPVANFVPNADHLTALENMGIARKKSIKALRETDNNVERAVDWVFSHPDDEGEDVAPANPRPKKLTDGAPTYKLIGFISHVGPSVHVGHYVCHLLKDGKWTIFNDEKVAISEKPPKNHGYLYLYQRK